MKNTFSKCIDEGADEVFVVRAYTKIELATLYLPNCTRRVALKRFNAWLRLAEPLWKRLSETGLTIDNRHLNPLQVRLIVEALGPP
ncbi:DUF4248 domain-containing protein [Bacteroides sp. OttesenSCG-928-M17]|nr:DUF4248 domain-containing protein [Bacteroides sp. OttesenSCG-928-M17]